VPIVPLILLNKPFRALCQFRDDQGRPTLADFVAVPKVYPAGRLDFDSEGLLLLTDDGPLQARISQPKAKLKKHYWVQVEGEITPVQVQTLLNGVTLKDGPAKAVKASVIAEPDDLWAREPPIRERQAIPTSWLDLVITEGRNRQVRRMTAAIGLPALRLIRHQVGPWSLDSLEPGQSRQMENDAAWKLLKS
jgi:23S rRNA pseudouridine2457 synthase